MHLDGITKLDSIVAPCEITLTRIGKRAMDSDNLAASLKYVRDAIAEHIFDRQKKLAPGRADGDERIEWIYKQEVGSEYAVRIQI